MQQSLLYYVFIVHLMARLSLAVEHICSRSQPIFLVSDAPKQNIPSDVKKNAISPSEENKENKKHCPTQSVSLPLCYHETKLSVCVNSKFVILNYLWSLTVSSSFLIEITKVYIRQVQALDFQYRVNSSFR